jgi:hypothetical protein
MSRSVVRGTTASRIVTIVRASFSVRSLMLHKLTGIVLGEGGGTAPHPLRVGDRRSMP